MPAHELTRDDQKLAVRLAGVLPLISLAICLVSYPIPIRAQDDFFNTIKVDLNSS